MRFTEGSFFHLGPNSKVHPWIYLDFKQVDTEFKLMLLAIDLTGFLYMENEPRYQTTEFVQFDLLFEFEGCGSVMLMYVKKIYFL